MSLEAVAVVTRLNIVLDSPKLIWALCAQLYSLAERPTHLRSYTRALLVSQDRKHPFVTPLLLSLRTKKCNRISVYWISNTGRPPLTYVNFTYNALLNILSYLMHESACVFSNYFCMLSFVTDAAIKCSSTERKRGKKSQKQ
jgi:hypothetical protein